VLLASASSGGTIAAVRNLGARGIDVGVISNRRLCAAAWSFRATRSYSAPPEREISRFLDRLLAIGEADPGQILLPTSDETAWLYTVHAALLEQHFCVYQPSIYMRSAHSRNFWCARTRSYGRPAFRSCVASGDGYVRPFPGLVPGRKPGRLPIFLVRRIVCPRLGEPAS
jgi:hypothetical protein